MGAVASLCAWVLNIPRLGDWGGTGIVIQPNSALAIVTAALALATLGRARRWTFAFAAATYGLGMATLLEHALKIDLGIDTPLTFNRAWGAAGTVSPGRMGIPATSSFTLLGLALLSARDRSRRGRMLASFLSWIAGSIAMVSIVGYLYRASPLFDLPRYTTIALQTATMIAALSMGLLASLPEQMPLRLLRKDGAGGAVLRQVWPVSIVVILVLGWLRVQGQQQGWYETALGTAMYSLSLVVLLTGLLSWCALTIDRRESLERQTSALLRASEGRLADQKRAMELALAGAPLGDVLGVLANACRGQLGGDLRTAIWVFDSTVQQYRLCATAGVDEAFRQAFAFREWEPGPISAVPEGHEPRIVRDIKQEPLWQAHLQTARNNAVRSEWLFPVRSAKGEPLGLVALYHARTQQPRPPFLERISLLVQTTALIIERAHAEAALRQNEERLRDSLSVGQLGSWQWNWHDGELTSCPQCKAHFGRAAEQLLTVADVRAAIHPDDMLQARSAVQQAIAGGGDFEAECRCFWPDGSLHWISGRGRATFDSHGQPARIIGVTYDVTQRREAEQSVRDSEWRFRTMAETVPSMVWTAAPDGEITYVNHHWLEFCGITAEQNARRWPELVLHPDDRERCLRQWREALASGDDYEIEVRNRRHDGVFRWFVTKATPLRDNDGRIVSWFGVSTDIHDLKMLEEQLRDADRRKNEFLATLAHELRNPLAPVRNSLEILKQPGLLPEDVSRVHQTMERQIAHMVRLIDDLMDVNRITLGKLTLRFDRVSLASIVEPVLEANRALCEQTGHQLHVAIPDEPIYLEADSVRLTQVFGNLLTNACKYSEPGSDIWLSAQRGDGQIEIRVRDSGLGIPADKLESVFELFEQVDNSLERTQGGLGIGLTLVKRLVELHGGTVGVTSPGLGHGSEFTFRLPVLGDPPPAFTHPDTIDAAAAQKFSILVVDDNRDSALSLAALLKLSGHCVAIAFDGREALRTGAVHCPDVVLLDLGMPNMNGYDACEAMRAEAWGKNALIVAISGWGQDDDRRRSARVGFDAHLVKPVDPRELSKLLVRFTSNRTPVTALISAKS